MSNHKIKTYNCLFHTFTLDIGVHQKVWANIRRLREIEKLAVL